MWCNVSNYRRVEKSADHVGIRNLLLWALWGHLDQCTTNAVQLECYHMHGTTDTTHRHQNMAWHVRCLCCCALSPGHSGPKGPTYDNLDFMPKYLSPNVLTSSMRLDVFTATLWHLLHATFCSRYHRCEYLQPTGSQEDTFKHVTIYWNVGLDII